MHPIRTSLVLFLLVATVTTSAGQPAGGMGIPQAAVLGAVEGLTEFLPVSSTGHLLVVQRLLGLDRTTASRDAANAYAIVIQLGAILAVLVVSWGRVCRMVKGLVGQDRGGLLLLAKLLVAFVPAAVAGFLLEDRMKEYLYHPWPIAAALAVGGLAILLFLRRKGGAGGLELEAIPWSTVVIIGLAQMLALWPGVSRSLATLGAGVLLGLSVSAAVEFSFLLGLVTLGAATVWELIGKGAHIVELFGWVSPLVGLVVAGVTGFIAVKWMVGYLKTRGLALFGWYRVGIGALLGVLILVGVL